MTGQRLEALDFWRGVVLATIFVNHIPGNVLSALTPRNFGFSDSSEAFVFISGASVALAYGSRFQNGGAVSACVALVRRASRLYFWHLALTAAALLLFGAAATLTGQDRLLLSHGCAFTLSKLISYASLAEQISYFNILPLYVVLLGVAPLLLLLGARTKFGMMLASLGVYALARLHGPDHGAWYFNPTAWQLMFAIGIFVGLSLPGGIVLARGLYRAALAFTVFAGIVVSNAAGFLPGLLDEAGTYLDWDKTDLGVVRIVAFVSLAYVIYYSGLSGALRALFPHFSLLGRNALAVFCLGSLLSALGQILGEIWVASALFDLLFVAIGLLVLLGCAAAVESLRNEAPRPGEALRRQLSRARRVFRPFHLGRALFVARHDGDRNSAAIVSGHDLQRVVEQAS